MTDHPKNCPCGCGTDHLPIVVGAAIVLVVALNLMTAATKPKAVSVPKKVFTVLVDGGLVEID